MVALGAALVSVVPIDANGFAFVVSELTEGTESQPTENHNGKDRTALPLVLLEPSEGTESQPTESRKTIVLQLAA